MSSTSPPGTVVDGAGAEGDQVPPCRPLSSDLGRWAAAVVATSEDIHFEEQAGLVPNDASCSPIARLSSTNEGCGAMGRGNAPTRSEGKAELRASLIAQMLDVILPDIEAARRQFDALPPSRTRLRREAVRDIRNACEEDHARAVILWPTLTDAQLELAHGAFDQVCEMVHDATQLERRAVLTVAERRIAELLLEFTERSARP